MTLKQPCALPSLLSTTISVPSSYIFAGEAPLAMVAQEQQPLVKAQPACCYFADEENRFQPLGNASLSEYGPLPPLASSALHHFFEEDKEAPTATTTARNVTIHPLPLEEKVLPPFGLSCGGSHHLEEDSSTTKVENMYGAGAALPPSPPDGGASHTIHNWNAVRCLSAWRLWLRLRWLWQAPFYSPSHFSTEEPGSAPSSPSSSSFQWWRALRHACQGPTFPNSSSSASLSFSFPEDNTEHQQQEHLFLPSCFPSSQRLPSRLQRRQRRYNMAKTLLYSMLGVLVLASFLFSGYCILWQTEDVLSASRLDELANDALPSAFADDEDEVPLSWKRNPEHIAFSRNFHQSL
ncbi:hypothetical protein QOT17_013796 [Balamuthia mandrillaris]